VYVEDAVAMAWESGAAVWSFSPDLWGECVQGRSVDDALTAWRDRHGPAEVAEVVVGDEQAFGRDLRPASDHEVALTIDVLVRERRRACALLDDLPPAVLDHDDPGQRLPPWARWRTIRQRLWHVCDTESRYYLPRTGLPSRQRAETLAEELRRSTLHVRGVLRSMPRDALNQVDGEVWTSTKLLRRLAWHERGELDAIDDLLRR